MLFLVIFSDSISNCQQQYANKAKFLFILFHLGINFQFNVQLAFILSSSCTRQGLGAVSKEKGQHQQLLILAIFLLMQLYFKRQILVLFVFFICEKLLCYFLKSILLAFHTNLRQLLIFMFLLNSKRQNADSWTFWLMFPLLLWTLDLTDFLLWRQHLALGKSLVHLAATNVSIFVCVFILKASWQLLHDILFHVSTLFCRQRPALGECLAHLAAAMPVAFLEPALNEFNSFSVYTTKTPRERTSELRFFL